MKRTQQQTQARRRATMSRLSYKNMPRYDVRKHRHALYVSLAFLAVEGVTMPGQRRRWVERGAHFTHKAMARIQARKVAA